MITSTLTFILGTLTAYVSTSQAIRVNALYSLPARAAYLVLTTRAHMAGLNFRLVGSWASGLATHAGSDLDIIVDADIDNMTADQLFEVTKRIESVMPVRFKKILPQHDGRLALKFNAPSFFGVDADVVVRSSMDYVSVRIGNLPPSTVAALRERKAAAEKLGKDAAKEYKSKLSRFARKLPK